jgi:hypothetical protein
VSDKPVFEIEASTNPKNSIEHVCTLLFDEPREMDKGSYMLYIYTVAANGEEHVMFAYEGLRNAIDKTGAKAGDTISIVKMGEGKSTTWYVDLIDSPVDSRPAARPDAPKRTKPNPMVVGGNKSTHVPSGSRRPGPYDVEDVVQLGLQFFLPAHQMVFGILTLAQTTPTNIKLSEEVRHQLALYEDLDLDQLARLATAIVLHGVYAFTDGQRPVWDEPVVDELTEEQDEFVRRVKGNLDLGIARAVLSALSDMYEMPAQEIANLFKAVQLSSNDLDENVLTTWLPFQAVVEEHWQNNPVQDDLGF